MTLIDILRSYAALVKIEFGPVKTTVRVAKTQPPMTIWQFIRAELRPGRPPEGEAKTLPPMAVWRFKQPQPALESAIQDAVRQFQGQIAWELGNKRNAWALYPKKVREVTEANKLAGLLGGLGLLMVEEPEFGMLANEEFEKLTAFLQKVINPTLLQEYNKNAGWP